MWRHDYQYARLGWKRRKKSMYSITQYFKLKNQKETLAFFDFPFFRDKESRLNFFHLWAELPHWQNERNDAVNNNGTTTEWITEVMSQAAKEDTAKWNFTTFTLIRWQSIHTIAMREQLFNLHIQKKKSKKKNWKKKFRKRSKCHISIFF